VATPGLHKARKASDCGLESETRVVEMPVTERIEIGTAKRRFRKESWKDSKPSSTKVLRFAANLLPSSKGGEL